MDDDDKAALIADLTEWLTRPMTMVRDSLIRRTIQALDAQPDLERVKREAGAAALREAARAMDLGDAYSEEIASRILNKRADRIERGE